MKFLIAAIALGAMTACGTPSAQAINAHDEVVKAEENLQVVKDKAAQDITDAHIAAAAEVDAAKADVVEARVALQTKLDKLDAAIVAIELVAKTPEQRDEIVKIRARQNTIVVQIRDRDKDGILWSDIEREVDQAVLDLDHDVETIRVKIVK